VGVGAWLRHRATMALDTAQRDILDLVSPERSVAPADSSALTAASQDISKRDCGAAVAQDEAAPENAVMGTSDRRRLHGALSGIAASQCKDEFVFCSSCCASAAATWLSRRVAFELPPRAPTACNGQLYAL